MRQSVPVAMILPAMILAALAAAGCQNAGAGSEDDAEPAFAPKVVAFEGKAAPEFAGVWTSTDGSSVLALTKDGTLEVAATSTSQNGKSTAKYPGRWLVSGKDLRLRYKDASGGETTIGYAATLAGNKLVLAQAGGRMKTTYLRK